MAFYEIENQDQLLAYLNNHDHLVDVAIQGLDLRPFETQLCKFAIQNAYFLGCKLTPSLALHIQTEGSVILPAPKELPYHPFRGTLYHPLELMTGYVRGKHSSFETHSLDSKIYGHYKESDVSNVIVTLYQRIHDHAIDDALQSYMADRRNLTVGMMGGHSLNRSDPRFRQVAHLAHTLHQNQYFIASGGGPGAMEAANLGAYMGKYSETDLDKALSILEDAPTYRDNGWFETALQVRDQFPSEEESLGVPTWFYGHEPSNLFASHHAKYFANSIREDGLLALSEGGIVYAPGSAGTIQEIFQDACQNHYGTIGSVSPMIFMDCTYWTKHKPVYPLLRELSKSRQYGKMLGIFDDNAHILEFLKSNPMEPFKSQL
ncbi:MAG: hypothetical protein VXZ96_06470 [Myxococcota bacterium]|nr:hypothetical protein [Myxococcota bacterium]MEC8379944.1 hypothetical protein [Myxococcota bacterium]